MREEDPDEEVAFLVSGSDPSRKNMISGAWVGSVHILVFFGSGFGHRRFQALLSQWLLATRGSMEWCMSE